MRRLTATLCLTIAVLLGSEVRGSDLPPCWSGDGSRERLGVGLKILAPQTSPKHKGKKIVLGISGQIINQTDKVIEVPLLIAILSDVERKAKASWNFHAKGRKILPGEKIDYETSIEDPPSGVANLEITFGGTNCFGSYIYADGGKYVGEWKHGKRHGQGTYTDANGDKYVGEYSDDKRHGQGTYTFADGDKYVGEWRDGKRHGQGTFTIASGDKYVGEWRDDNANGQGTLTFSDGDKYVGEWKHGKRHGQGTYTDADGCLTSAPAGQIEGFA